MLIRVSGAKEGIREYLETGKKQGRGFDREDLDERIILRGDLAVTDGILQEMSGDGDKYLHVTISFKEDEVSRETLHAIVEEFKEFAFSAYNEDEFDCYAEAHLPKIKSYVDERTGEFIERKPHIHIVIPKTNLLSGQYLSPFGKFEQNESFVSAFQETINAKYGLASPKDNRRLEMTDASEMISRYKGDLFQATGRSTKERILSEMLSNNITSYDVFKNYLNENGTLKVRNAGRDNEYLHVKTIDDAKGLNLREFVFSREFVELSDAQKRARLASEVERRYEVGGKSRKPAKALLDTLADWKERRSKEIKYLNSGNRKTYQQYRQADPDQRKLILADRAARFYAKHRQEQDYGRVDTDSRLERIGSNLRAASRHLETAGRNIEKAGRSAGTTTNLADRGNRRALAAALERVAGAQIRAERIRFETGQPVRRAADSVAAQVARDAGDKGKQSRAEGLTEFQIIKRDLDAKRLLQSLSRSHGVIAQKYEITKGRDGSDRIKCGSRKLNVSDFVTKEMNLPWREAATVLRSVYREQKGKEPFPLARQQPRREIWKEYQIWRKGKVDEGQQKWDIQRSSERERRATIKRDFAHAKALNYAKHPAGSKHRPSVEQRRATMSVIRMDRVQREMTLRENIETERNVLKAQYQKPYQEQYREFLSERAQGGDETALTELRRMRPDEAVERSNEPRIGANEAQNTKRSDRLMEGDGLTYQVHRNGDVTYKRGGKAVLRDEGKSVLVLKTDDKTIEMGLRIAVQKHGGELALAGSAEFQKRAAELVAEKGMRVSFADDRLNQIVRNRQRSMAEEAKNLTRAREFLKAADDVHSVDAESRSVMQGALPSMDSMSPDTVKGSYSGKVVGADDSFVYQQSGQTTVRHDREAPRKCRRLWILAVTGDLKNGKRKQSKEANRGEIFRGGSGARGPDGVGAPARIRDAGRGDALDCLEDGHVA